MDAAKSQASLSKLVPVIATPVVYHGTVPLVQETLADDVSP